MLVVYSHPDLLFVSYMQTTCKGNDRAFGLTPGFDDVWDRRLLAKQSFFAPWKIYETFF